MTYAAMHEAYARRLLAEGDRAHRGALELVVWAADSLEGIDTEALVLGAMKRAVVEKTAGRDPS